MVFVVGLIHLSLIDTISIPASDLNFEIE